MNAFVVNILLAGAWSFAHGGLSIFQFGVGFVLGYAALWLGRDVVGAAAYCARVPRLLELLVFFLWELLRANLRVAADVLMPHHHLRPGIIALPLDAKTDTEIMLLANLITLTPGSFSLGPSNDRRVLYVHSLHIEDLEQEKKSIKDGFEWRLLRVLR